MPKIISASAMAVFDINGYIGGMNEAGGSAVPFGQFESTSNEEYKNLMASYLDKNVSLRWKYRCGNSVVFQKDQSEDALGNWLKQDKMQRKMNMIFSLQNKLQ